MREQTAVNIGIDVETQEKITLMVRDALDERLENIEDEDLDNVFGAVLMAQLADAMIMK